MLFRSDDTSNQDSELQNESAVDEDSIASSDQDIADTDSTKLEDTKTSAETQQEKKAKPAPAIFKAEKKAKGFLAQIMEGGLLLWGSLGGIAIILSFFVFWRMKKRMEDDDFQDDLVASAGAGSMDTTETFELPDVGDDMLVELDMDDDEESGAKQNSDESFDPLGEADIYIAYGKYEQAESLLLDAVDDNPVRADFKVKLMECYAEMGNKDKFELLENDVQEAIDFDEWREPVAALKAKAWGEEDFETDSDIDADADEDDFDLPSTEDIFGESDDDDELDIDFDDALSDIDDLDDDVSEGADDIKKLEPDDKLSLDDSDFEIADFDSEETDLDIEEVDVDELELDDLDIDEENFELDSEETLALDENDSGVDDLSGQAETEDSILVEESDLSSDSEGDEEISLDVEDDLDFGGDDEDIDFEDSMADDGDEISTKSDLARAYVDMGDADGAKEILREVIAEGNDEQQAEAQALIDKSD